MAGRLTKPGNFEMHRVLITGGAGFVGTNLVASLSRQGGYEITVLDNESRGTRKNIQSYDVRFIPADIKDGREVAKVLSGVETVVHLAAESGVMDSIVSPLSSFENNVRATVNLLLMAKDAGVTRIINASTGGAILGEVSPPINEEIAARPVSPYGASKLAVEGYCSAFSAAYGMQIVSLRFSNLYGPWSLHKKSVVAHFFKRILAGEDLTIYGDGSQKRDYLFVEDLNDVIAGVMNREISGIYQLGTGKPHSLNELITLMRTTMGPAHPFRVRYKDFRDGEIRHTWCDISKAATDLGFQPETSLENGLRLTWEWFLRAHEHRAASSG